ncbi:MAG: DUF6084 family protein [Terriglobales bacterium]
MPEIQFLVETITAAGADSAPVLMPGLRLRLRVINGTPEPVHSMLVRCQVQIEPALRRYSDEEAGRLTELFGEPERWAHTLRTVHWQTSVALVGGFTGTTAVELPLACGYDFAAGATKYLSALAGAGQSEIPLRLLFSGTVFYQSEAGVAAAPIPWDLEARYRMPAAIWREAIAHCYPDGAWIRVSAAALEQVRRFQAARGIATLEQALELLVAAPGGAKAAA